MGFVRQALGQACRGAEEAAGAVWCLAGVVVWGSLDPLPLSLRIGAAPAVFSSGEEAVVQKGCPILVMGDPGLNSHLLFKCQC